VFQYSQATARKNNQAAMNSGDINFDSFFIENKGQITFNVGLPNTFEELSEPSPISSKDGTPERQRAKVSSESKNKFSNWHIEPISPAPLDTPHFLPIHDGDDSERCSSLGWDNTHRLMEIQKLEIPPFKRKEISPTHVKDEDFKLNFDQDFQSRILSEKRDKNPLIW